MQQMQIATPRTDAIFMVSQYSQTLTIPLHSSIFKYWEANEVLSSELYEQKNVSFVLWEIF